MKSESFGPPLFCIIFLQGKLFVCCSQEQVESTTCMLRKTDPKSESKAGALNIVKICKNERKKSGAQRKKIEKEKIELTSSTL